MSIGEDVRAAMTEVSGKGEAPAGGDSPVPVGVPEGAAMGVPLDSHPTPSRTRDESGRFAKREDKPQETATPVPPKPEAPVAPTPQKRTAPQSWRPIIREHWEKLPPEVQEEVYRVEGTTRNLVQQAAQHRKQVETWEKTLAPYRPYIQGEPSQWAEGIIRQAVQLQTAPAQQRAAIAAQILRESGVDIRLLDAALQQEEAPQQHRGQQQDHELRSELEELRAQLREIQTAPMAREVEEFTKAAEFIDEPMPDGRHTVREMVAVHLKAAGMQGVALSLQDAYDAVVARHPTIQEALKQRAEAKAHAERSASTARAQAASSSVRTEHVVTPPPDDKGGSVHDDVRATVAMLRKGR